MSASTQEQTNGHSQGTNKRPQRTKAQIAAMTKKAAATRAANKLAAANQTNGQITRPLSSIQPTPARAAAMTARATPAKDVNPIAQGFAAELLTAGPSWSADYQKQFLAGLTAVLPGICISPRMSAAA